MTPHPHAHDTAGSVISRRQALALFAAPAVLAVAGCRAGAADGDPLTGSCLVRPEMTEGPFYLDDDLVRRDIRDGSAGVPLALTIGVSRVAGASCEPLAGAAVDVWHADAAGRYSGVGPARDERFLRGTQVTDAEGVATFVTVYPGWYPGRTPHVHFKVRADAGGGRTHAFTSQLFFDDALSESLYRSAAPYAERGPQNVTNARDGIFRRGGDEMLLALAEADGGGYAAAFDLAMVLDR